ncbi:hypothetical protein [Kitasatospora sp. McL0602]|uniref:hypothetical protein n=1 Tax=Kitasatospora sp. McL0602 TaxID=3439530 RepID=UPI003F88E9AA
MAALLTPSASASVSLPRRRWLRGVSWLSGRQERTAFAVAGAVLLVVCGWLLFLGGVIGDYVTTNHLEHCNIVYFPPECQSVNAMAAGLDMRWQLAVEITGWLLLALPPALGLFLGAPLLAREFETGTYRLAWTQSVSRRRWLAARLGVPLAVTLAGSTVLAAVSTWWVSTVEGRLAVPGYYHWFTWLSRTTSGPAVVGFCLVGLALGAAVGLVVRRVVASMAVTAALTLVLRLLIDNFRFLLTPAKESVGAAHVAVIRPNAEMLHIFAGTFPTSTPLESLLLGDSYITTDGTRIPSEYGSAGFLSDGRILCQSPECLAHPDIVQVVTRYQPPSAHWPMLWTETGLCLAATVVLVAFCFLWIRRVR